MKMRTDPGRKMYMKMNMNVKMKPNMTLQMGMRHCRSAGYPGDQIKAAGQEGIVESVWVPIVPLWRTPRGGCDGAHVRAGLRPVDGGPPAPRARVENGKGNAVKVAKDAANRKGSEVTPEKSEGSVDSMRLPNISHAVMNRLSLA
jgi:hypothetical protein